MNYKKWLPVTYFFFFSVIFMFIVPPSHSPDELGHISYINFISEHYTLPVQNNPQLKEPMQGHQPPLYYLAGYVINYILNNGNIIHVKLTGPAGGPFDLKPEDTFANPFNYFSDNFIYYILKLFSVLLGVLNIYFISKIAELVFTDKKIQFLCSFFAATLPQFAFITSSVNNDNLVNLFATITIYFIYRALLNPDEIKNYFLASVFFSLGLLSKKTISYLLIAIAVVVLYNMFLSRKVSLKRILAFLIPVIIITGWYFYRNYILYSEVWGFKAEENTFSSFEHKPLFSAYFVSPFLPGVLTSFIAFFGFMNIRLLVPAYFGYILIFLTVPFVFLKKFLIIKKDKIFLLSLFITLLAIAGVVYYNLYVTQYQGRFLFPALASIAVLISLSIGSLIHNIRYSNIIYYSIIIYFIFMDVYSILNLYFIYY